MASVFKRGRDKKKRRPHWYISYTDHTGRRRTKKGFTDKALSEQLGAKLENEAMLRQRGLIDPEDERIATQKATLLTVHLSGFEKSLAPNSSKYVKLVMNRVKRIIAECEFEVAGDINPDIVSQGMAELRESEKFGHRTYNHYVQALHTFCNWLVASRRLPSNPVVGLERLNTEVDIRHPRRALAPEEVQKLVQSARTSGETVQALSGDERARIYIVSFMTGLRRKELASLTPRSFDLDGNPPTLTVKATVSKHRKKDVLPLHPELVTLLREWTDGMLADAYLFPDLDRKKTWLMVKKDLERIGIPYETTEGIADFHAAGRHSHVTELLRSGASLPEARELARHADVRTTMKYTHIGMEDRARALGNLRWQRIGSGTRDVARHSVAANDNDKDSPINKQTDRREGTSSTSVTDSQPLASVGNDESESAKRVRFPPPPVCQLVTTGDDQRPNPCSGKGFRVSGLCYRCHSMTRVDSQRCKNCSAYAAPSYSLSSHQRQVFFAPWGLVNWRPPSLDREGRYACIASSCSRQNDEPAPLLPEATFHCGVTP
jgi:integrase